MSIRWIRPLTPSTVSERTWESADAKLSEPAGSGALDAPARARFGRPDQARQSVQPIQKESHSGSAPLSAATPRVDDRVKRACRR